MTEGEYEPKIDAAAWTEIRAFVQTTVGSVAGHTPYSDQALSLALTRLAHWATSSAGIEPEESTLLRREIINRFIDVGCPGQTDAARGNLRTQLLRVAEAVMDPRFAPVRLSALSPAEPSAPYTRPELAALSSWVESQTTAYRRDNARTLVALGLGAGLSASEIGNIRAGDIARDDSGVLVRVTGARSREVPSTVAQEETIWSRAEMLSPENYMFRPEHGAYYPNLVNSFVRRGQRSGVVPQSQRLRATWIVAHLDAGTPTGPLLDAAGVDSLEAFTRYVRFLAPVDDALARALLRLA